MSGDAAAAASADRFLGGKVTLLQPVRGHRAGLDAALLQAALPPEAAGRAVELGCGVGTAAFCVAARAPGLAVLGIDSDAELVALGRAALALPENAGFAARVRLAVGDATARRGERQALGLADGSADFVLMNPPYATAGRVRASPDAGRRRAHVAAAGDLAAWIRTAAGLLGRRGRLSLIHRADALPEILAALAGRFGDAAVLPVRPQADAAASRIVVAAVKGSRRPLRLLPGLVLHRPGGAWTEPAAALLEGRGHLPL